MFRAAERGGLAENGLPLCFSCLSDQHPPGGDGLRSFGADAASQRRSGSMEKGQISQ